MEKMERPKLTRDQQIILGDAQVEAFIDRARYIGCLDGMVGAECRPFFENRSEMTREQQVLYDERVVEDAISQAYRTGRELGQQLGWPETE